MASGRVILIRLVVVVIAIASVFLGFLWSVPFLIGYGFSVLVSFCVLSIFQS